ncbi:MAG: YbaK/EbsC family protein [Eubacteriaceae bacterium]|nr:YbaK/EbsC family protein [Eubacteriaceae bacterium]
MSIELARKGLEQFGLTDNIVELDTSSATVELAASALNCHPGQIAKTLAISLKDGYMLLVTSGDTRIDNKKFKAIFTTRPKMLSPEETATIIGHEVGGVCPFGVDESIAIYLDESLKRYEIVHPACGSSNSLIRLTIRQLEETSKARDWIDVCIIP